jgi:hypothetical protein
VDIASGTKGRVLGVDDAKVLHTDIEADSLGELGRGSKKANPLK